MTIIVFLVDTSASMNQRAYVNGRKTLLDVSKEAVEVFVKQRQKSTESRGDRYMLLTFDEFPRNIKAGWKENLTTFMAELKNLEAAGMTTLGSALKAVFDTLNINRMQSGIDMYGQGRYPYYLEPAVIVVVTDGGKLTTSSTVQRELNLPMGGAGMGGMSGVPGAELTREPFRWDQRLYALVLRMAGHPPMTGSAGESGHVASDCSPVDAMCEVTGGRSYAVTSNRVLHQCIESLVQKLQSGVVIHFEKSGSDPPLLGEETALLGEEDTLLDPHRAEIEIVKSTIFREAGAPGSRPHTPNPVISGGNTAWHSCRKLIYVQRSAQKGFAVGFWPLPESFWPDVNASALPGRSAHPTLKFTCTNQEPMIIDNLPFDKYELEPSPLTLFILGRKQPNYCWQVFIQGSTKNGDTGHPFGYLKASTNLLTVNLFVLPYNYPMLLPLLDDLFKLHRLKPTNEWRTQFHNYLRTMPAYYAGPLRRALTRMGAGNLATSLIPETMDNSLSYSVLNYLKRLKNQAKLEYDRIVSMTPFKGKFGPDGIKVLPRSPLKRELLENPALRETPPSLRDQLTDFPGYMLGLPEKAATETHPLRNPFDISRASLLDQVVRMRANLLCGRGGISHLIDEDTRHSLPIGQMGNYQDYLKKQPTPLRELESAPVRQHMFGNPFKTNKNLMMMDEVSGVDEVQIVSPGAPPVAQQRGIKRPAEQTLSAPPKRRKGPLSKDFQFSSPAASPVHTPQIPEIDLKLEIRPPSPPSLPSLPLQPSYKPVLVNGTKPVNSLSKMAAFFKEDADRFDDACLNVIEPVKPLVKDESLRILNRKKDPPPSRNPVSKNNKLELIRNEVNKSIADTILSNLNEIHGPDLQAWHSNGQADKIYRKPEIAFNAYPKESFELNASAVKRLNEELLATPPVAPAPKSVPTFVAPPPVLEVEEIKQIPEKQPTKEELRSINLRNNNVRQLIYKEVKRPGRSHLKLWTMLEELQGPAWVRKQFILEVKQEAIRFKRRELADQLEDRCKKLAQL